MELEQQPMQSAVVQQAAGQDLFMQKRIELMIDMAGKKMQSEMQLLRKMVLQLEQELVELRKQIHTQAQVVHMQQAPQSKPEPQPEQQQLRQQGQVRSETTQSAPRYGKYTSNDVSIEKLFNFSGKKM